MDLSVKIDTKGAEAAIRKLAGLSLPTFKRAGQAIGQAFARKVSNERMAGRPGLYTRDGNLRKSLISRTTGNSFLNVETVVGFLDQKAAQIARLHEFGTVGKGGLLPDIVPVRAKALRWFSREGTAAKSSNGSWMFAKRVSIPARLGFFDTWRKLKVDKILREAEERWARAQS